MSPLQASNPGRIHSSDKLSAESAAALSWQKELAAAIRDPELLLETLKLPKTLANHIPREFPLLVPRSFVGRMTVGDVDDPLLRQVLPVRAESVTTEGFSSDPVGDLSARSAPGLLQKYAGRALLITTGACAVHCRYCFRREYPYQDDPRRLEDWQPALRAIQNDPTIHEVLLSGGDPLMLNDARLAQLMTQLDAIPHVQRIRLHTRLPIVLPSRITSQLLTLFSKLRCQVVVVVHANHGNEIVNDCADALSRIVQSGIPVLNQAVLLKSVNDNVAAMATLSQNLINLGVMPYYLHQLDQVNGAAHFQTEDSVGIGIINELRKTLPGYAVPKFVREIPSADSKTPIV